MRFTSLSIAGLCCVASTIAAPVDNNNALQFSQYFKGSQIFDPSKATANNKIDLTNHVSSQNYRTASNNLAQDDPLRGLESPGDRTRTDMSKLATSPETTGSGTQYEEIPNDPFLGAEDRELPCELFCSPLVVPR